MDDQHVGAVLRALRLRRKLRQVDVADRAGCAHATISRVERGHIGELTLTRLRAAAGAVDARIIIDVRWSGAGAARLLDERHAGMQQALAARFAALPDWTVIPEASFSIYGERGSVDLLAWHRGTGMVLVVELKSEVVDLQDLLATVDRKRRLAPAIARERGWTCRSVGAWVVLEEGRQNRRRVAAYRDVLHRAFPCGGRAIRSWLARPDGPVAALSFMTIAPPMNGRRSAAPRSRVSRRPKQVRAQASCRADREPARPRPRTGAAGARWAGECSAGER